MAAATLQTQKPCGGCSILTHSGVLPHLIPHRPNADNMLGAQPGRAPPRDAHSSRRCWARSRQQTTPWREGCALVACRPHLSEPRPGKGQIGRSCVGCTVGTCLLAGAPQPTHPTHSSQFKCTNGGGGRFRKANKGHPSPRLHAQARLPHSRTKRSGLARGGSLRGVVTLTVPPLAACLHARVAHGAAGAMSS
jgi:hypothetical protein